MGPRDEAWGSDRAPADTVRAVRSVSILIPAHNEVDRIADTVAGARLAASGAPLQIVVVDDGSTDMTADAAELAGADRVIRQTNRGKGGALTAGVVVSNGAILLLLDADLGATAAEASRLLAPVLAGDADMTIATFPVRPGRGGGGGRVVRLARWGIRRLTGRTMAAPLSGQRALTRALLDDCGGFAPGWGVEVELTVRALWAGGRVVEVPTQMDHRVTGRSLGAIVHRALQFGAAAMALARLWRSRPPGAGRSAQAESPDG
jgi:glycosyltransferase involved in cell wall biosynthesis